MSTATPTDPCSRTRHRAAAPPRPWAGWSGIAATIVLLALAGCKPKTPPVVPERAVHLQPSSTVLADADLLVRALAGGDLTIVQQWMTPEMRSRLTAEGLDAASSYLRREFGPVQGLLEERTHHEGSLLWYSGIWIHRREHKQGGAVVTPVLYQFALDDKRQLARLLVREHWFLESIQGTADAYVPITRLRFPGIGEWTISHGGRSKAINHHFGNSAQRFAYDIVVKRNGRRTRPGSDSHDNGAYYCYGAQIRAPAAGRVIVVVNDVRENVIGGPSGEKGGNGVVIDHGFGEYSSLWHGIPGSVRVAVGDEVEAGQLLFLAGNSGHSSGPHLHYHLSSRGRRGGDLGLPAPFVDVWIDGQWHESFEPVRGDAVRGDPPPGVQRRDQARGPRVLVDL